MALSAQTYSINTIAGGGPSAGAIATGAAVFAPVGVGVDAAGNVYVLPSHSDLVTSSDLYVMNPAGTITKHLVVPILLPASHPAIDAAGNIYIADGTNGARIWKTVLATGATTVVAGTSVEGFSGDGGPASLAQLNAPSAVALDAAGNLYIADTSNNRVRKIDAKTGVISTIAGTGAFGGGGDTGPAVAAQLNQPGGVAVDGAGNIYIADSGNNTIRRIDARTAVITTIAGDGAGLYAGDNGPSTAAEINNPQHVAVDGAGNIYVLDFGNARVRKIAAATGIITTVAGNGSVAFRGDGGPATNAALNSPGDMAVDAAGNIFLADTDSNRIRKVDVKSGNIATIAGNGTISYGGDGGPATGAQLNFPGQMTLDAAGNVYVVDNNNYRVRRISAATGTITNFAGTGVQGFSGDGGSAATAKLDELGGIVADAAGNVYIADRGNSVIRKVTAGVISTFAGGSGEFVGPSDVGLDSAGNLYVADAGNQRVVKVDAKTAAISVAVADVSVYGLAVDAGGNVYFSDIFSNQVRRVAAGSATAIVVAGTGVEGFSGDGGPATAAQLNQPTGIAVDAAGNLYIADNDNNRVRRVDAATGVISAIAGSGPTGNPKATFGGDGSVATSALLNQPNGVAVDNVGGIYIADTINQRIRKLTGTTAPLITSGGITPVYSAANVIQPGSWISIYGVNLAKDTVLWNDDFPKTLGGVSVTINKKAAYLWFVSPTQINLQAPDDAALGTVNVTVTNSLGVATSTVALAAASPSFSLLGDGKHVAGVIATPNGSGAYGAGGYDLVGPAGAFPFATRPVTAGEVLVLYGVGFGPVIPAVAAGQPVTKASATATAVTITIGGVAANVLFAGITQAGLYQINLVVPDTGRYGDVAIQAVLAGGAKTLAGPVLTLQAVAGQ